MERLSTLPVTVAVPGLRIPGFSVPDFQRAAVATFGTLLPTVKDSALLPLLEQLFLMQTNLLVPSTPSPTSFAAIGQSLLHLSYPVSPSSTSSTADKDIAQFLAFQAQHPLLNVTDVDALRTFLQAWTNYKTTGLLSMYDCISADACTALELVYMDRLYRNEFPRSN